jgi:hypothetical protein
MPSEPNTTARSCRTITSSAAAATFNFDAPLKEVPLAQDHFVALMNARQKLMAYVVAERLAEGWEPWSTHDVDMLVQVGGAITILDRLIKEEPTFPPGEDSGPRSRALSQAHAISSEADSSARRRLAEFQWTGCKRQQEPGGLPGASRWPDRMRVRARDQDRQLKVVGDESMSQILIKR